MEKETLIQIEPGNEKVQTIRFSTGQLPEIRWHQLEPVGNTTMLTIVRDEPKTEYRFDFTVIGY